MSRGSSKLGGGTNFFRQLFATESSVTITVLLDSAFGGPSQLPLHIEATELIYCIKARIACILRHTGAKCGHSAEEISLEHRGMRLRNIKGADACGIVHGYSLKAHYSPQPPEREQVPRDAGYAVLDNEIVTEPCVPSSGTVKRIVAARGARCQVCYERRWFRAEIIHVHGTSLLVAWLDWPEARWPHFRLQMRLPATAGEPLRPGDETWRVRWPRQGSVADLPLVCPRFFDLPPEQWIKALLNAHVLRDELLVLQALPNALAPSKMSAVGAPLTRGPRSRLRGPEGRRHRTQAKARRGACPSLGPRAVPAEPLPPSGAQAS